MCAVCRSCTETNKQQFLFVCSKTPMHRAIDLDEKPLLYDYYANTLNPIIDKRNFDEIDRFAFGKRFFLERPRPVTVSAGPISVPGTEQKFHEIERDDYHDYMKRMMNDEPAMKRRQDGEFDEIDRFSLNPFSLFKNMRQKRNFDEIDRFGPEMFADTKRRMPTAYHDDFANDLDRTNKFLKFV